MKHITLVIEVDDWPGAGDDWCPCQVQIIDSVLGAEVVYGNVISVDKIEDAPEEDDDE